VRAKIARNKKALADTMKKKRSALEATEKVSDKREPAE
jgi:hypothetical protein